MIYLINLNFLGSSEDSKNAAHTKGRTLVAAIIE
jgi:hypothetical protein